MTRTEFSDSIIELVGLLAERNYSQNVIDATLGILSPLTTHNKVMAIKQFTRIVQKGLPEEEFHCEISQVVKELNTVPKNASKAMVQKTIAPYVQRDRLTVYLRKCDIEDITNELLSKYSNVYCSTSIDKKGGQIFYVKSKARHTKFIEIIVK